MGRVVRCLLLAILLAAANGCGADRQKPEAAAEAFLKYWAEQDFTAMYELLDPPSREKYSREYFINRYQNISGGIGLNSLEYSITEQLELIDDLSRFSFSATLQTASVGPIPLENTITLTREERRSPWLVAWEPALIFPELGENHRVELTRQAPQRGHIYDRHQRPLAEHRVFKEAGAVPGEYENEDALVLAVAGLLGLSPASLESKLNQPWVRDGLFVPLAVLEPGQEALIPQLAAIQGITIRNTTRRYYPAGAILGHLVGYLGELTAEELAEKRELGYYSGDLVGKAGLEAALDTVLGGLPGFTLRIVEADGTPAALIAAREGQPAADITLTIDLALQQAAAEALEDRVGAVVAMDPVSGEILALYNQPGLDSNWFIAGLSASKWQDMLADPARPLLNRALEGLYPPGSIFKVYTAAAAVQAGALDPNRVVRVEGSSWQPSPAWGSYRVRRVNRDTEMNLYDAMKYSDNIYFAMAGLALGAEMFESFGSRFGFGERVPFNLPVAVSQLSRAGLNTEILLADSSYGQGEVLLTPLHAALLFCAVAGGGDIPVPRLLMAEEPDPAVWKEGVIGAETAAAVHRSLVNAIHGEQSVAAAGAVEGYTAAGKTGTAQVDSIEGNICWYVTYAPAERPRVLVVAMVEGGTWATVDALPVARAVLERFLELDY